MNTARWLIGSLLFVGCVLAGWNMFESGPPTVSITAEEFRFVPGKVEIHAFQNVRFLIRNQGRERHVFYGSFFEDQAVRIVWESGERPREGGETLYLPLGKSMSFIAMFPPGLYPFRCIIQGHRGMEGMLVVRKKEG